MPKSPSQQFARRPLGIQLLAALLTVYAMGGFLLAMQLASQQDPRFRWWAVALSSAAFAIGAGLAALSVWRLERRSPWMLIVCGALGSVLCLTLPASAPPAEVTREMWRSAIQGAVLILLFLLIAAWYVRRVLRARA